jgi:hypothetical protein
MESARALIRETESFGVASTFTEHSLLKAKNSAKQAAIEHPVSKRAAKRHRDDSTADSTTGCTSCGRSNHQVQDCNFSKSQFFNTTTAVYKGSDAYNKLIAAYPMMKYIPGSIEINAMKSASNLSRQRRRGSVARCYTYTVHHGPAIQPGVPFRVYDIHMYITALYSYLRYSSVTIVYPSIHSSQIPFPVPQLRPQLNAFFS